MKPSLSSERVCRGVIFFIFLFLCQIDSGLFYDLRHNPSFLHHSVSNCQTGVVVLLLSSDAVVVRGNSPRRLWHRMRGWSGVIKQVSSSSDWLCPWKKGVFQSTAHFPLFCRVENCVDCCPVNMSVLSHRYLLALQTTSDFHHLPLVFSVGA